VWHRIPSAHSLMPSPVSKAVAASNCHTGRCTNAPSDRRNAARYTSSCPYGSGRSAFAAQPSPPPAQQLC
jgi:hypothetical protein